MPHTYGQVLNDDLAELILTSPYNTRANIRFLMKQCKFYFQKLNFLGLFSTWNEKNGTKHPFFEDSFFSSFVSSIEKDWGTNKCNIQLGRTIKS